MVAFNAAHPDVKLYARFDGVSWTEISAYVNSIDTRRPSSRETFRYGVGTMSVTLDNDDARFTPANTAGPYGAALSDIADIDVLLTATWDSVTYNLFVGRVEDWQDDYRALGFDAVTVMTCVDPLADLGAWSGLVDTSEDVPGELPGTFDVIGSAVQELSGLRFTKVLDAAGFSSSRRSIMGGDEQLMRIVSEGNAIDLLNLVADTEGGSYWYDPHTDVSAEGGIVYESRTALATQTRSLTSQVTFDDSTGVGFRDLRTSSGREQIIRSAEVQRAGDERIWSWLTGNPRWRRTNLLNEAAVGLVNLARWVVKRGSIANQYRITQVTLDPADDPATMWPAALGLRIRDRVTIDVTIPVSGFNLTRDAFIDGISHTIKPMSWSTTFGLASASVYDDLDTPASTFGVAEFDDNFWPY
jgi:hypothetical protein